VAILGGEKSLRICLLVLTQYMNVTDSRTDGQIPDDGLGRVYALLCAAKMSELIPGLRMEVGDNRL